MSINSIDISWEFYIFSNKRLQDPDSYLKKYEYDIEEVKDIVLKVGDKFKWKIIEIIQWGHWTYRIVTEWANKVQKLEYSIKEANQYDAMFGKPDIVN